MRLIYSLKMLLCTTSPKFSFLMAIHLYLTIGPHTYNLNIFITCRLKSVIVLSGPTFFFFFFLSGPTFA